MNDIEQLFLEGKIDAATYTKLHVRYRRIAGPVLGVLYKEVPVGTAEITSTGPWE
jgi:hypothetical protein